MSTAVVGRLWHNADCSKSREALQLLEASKSSFTVREYLKHPPSMKELQALGAKLAVPPSEWVRDPPDGAGSGDLLAAVLDNPAILQRPIFELGDRAIVARPPTLVLTVLEAQRLASARELVEPAKVNWPLVVFTFAFAGSYLAYVYLVELPADQAAAAAEVPQPEAGSGVHRLLPDGRQLMKDGSIRSAPK